MAPLPAGNCPVSPLAQPRHLTDGAAASGALAGSNPSALVGTMSSVALAVGASEAYLGGSGGAAGDARQQQQQRSPMRKRIVNLTAAADGLPPTTLMAGGLPRSASPTRGMLGRSTSPDGGSPAAAGGSRAAAVISGIRELAANPDLPLGLYSSLRASAPSGSPKK